MATKPKSQPLSADRPKRATFLPYGRQAITEEDIAAVVEVLRSDWLTTGPKVVEFEEKFAAEVGAHHAVSFSSGTAALHGTAFAAQLGAGDEAIVPALTFCATANCVVYQGATPKIADVAADTLNLDAARAEPLVTKRTRAIYAVDYAGHPAALDELRTLAHERNALLIEDACHALGAEYKRKRVGALADMTVFSFHPVKHITTGEGGMVTTNDAHLAGRLRTFRNHGITTDARERQAAGQWHYEMTELGYNYRLTDIACALGLSQLRRLSPNVARRRALAARYTAAFSRLPEILPPQVRTDANPAWHLYPIRLRDERLRAAKRDIFSALRAANIGVNVHYPPLHLHPYYQERFGYRGGECPAAENAYAELLSLPMFHAMTDQDVDDVITAIREVVASYPS